MRHLKIILLLTSWWIVSACSNSANLASESIQEGKIFCNPFAAHGFRGVLSINSSQNNFSYESNTSILSFYDVPDTFKTQKDTYIQLFGINYVNNNSSFSQESLEVDVWNVRNLNRSSITSYIDHQFIQNENYAFNEFFAEHAFIIKSTAGWDVLFIGLFNEYDKPILQTKVLFPPLEANPYIYEENKDKALNQLHPFNNLKTKIERASDDIFLSKAEAACRENPY